MIQLTQMMKKIIIHSISIASARRCGRCLSLGLLLSGWQLADAGAIIVAAANSTAESKRRADLVCDGKDDQVELLASFTRASRVKTVFERNPATLEATECFAGHSVEWLPGDYHLSETLTIPDAEDCVIQAEGTRFQYSGEKGDAIVLQGMSRCRYRFGTVFSSSEGAALRVQPTENMPALMSIVSFTGLIGNNQKGIGLCVDSSVENVCTMRFEGTDIRGFDVGVLVADARASRPDKPGSGKTDTNWYWFSYIRMCNTCIWEKRNGIDSGNWSVNVDASIPNSTAIRTAANYGRWSVIMGTYSRDNTRAVILDPGAGHNVIEVTPPIGLFAPSEDRSGNDSNVIMNALTPATINRPGP